MSVDILLIRPNDQKSVYSGVFTNAACEPPFWLALIAAYVKEKGFTVSAIDAEVLNQSPEETANLIAGIRPIIIGLIVTGTNLSASTQKMNGAGILTKAIKKMSEGTPVFMWGLHPSSLPEQTMEDEDIDYVIKGEGLDSICELVAQVKGGSNDKANIKGLYYRDGSKICGNPNIAISDINLMPKPAWDLLPMARYKAHNWQRLATSSAGTGGGYGVIAATLGCPYNCSFCAISTLFGQRKVRYKDPITVIEEIDELVNNYGVFYIKIIDECFVLNKAYVSQICDLLIERGYPLDIWAYARVDTVDKEILKKLKRANINWLAYGIESADNEVLANVAKGQYSVTKTKEVMQMTKDAGISILANFMFGLPEDNLNSMKATLALARDINPDFINMYCTMAYPGSALYHECIEKGIKLPDSWLGYAQLSYECEPLPTKYLTSREVLAFRDYAFNAFFDDNEEYFQNIRGKFGEKGIAIIQDMLKSKLKRKLLEGTNG